ncbi:putative YhdH/YhfP family quinone oxidoreductase [Paenibacillus endophyticus]|uniref:Putative YhdH/YhfP family quinone oxidoreductase n=1 Tax=Paenibacillus endophyticus TaxID=1294268 RepID=A0A7W5GAW8_9BACL|nr:oxidoreductase [Paenibacillus endophyticus]MBB3153206.1 putative YhdH/YhfP family quinone oxidoreductase [Paenibacillus endophyticus]
MPGFKALVIDHIDGKVAAGIKRLEVKDLPEGELLIRVAYSSVNYKDALACKAGGGVVKSYPFVPGIDLAGTIVASEDDGFRPGEQIIVTGYGLGVIHYGGYSEYARVPAEWAVKLPENLTMKEAMILGTAGFTAGLSVYELQQSGIRPEDGPILVTGATGGVGSVAAAIAAKLGYEVAASTGKADKSGYLRELGVKRILAREELGAGAKKALDKQRWAGAIDCVGGETLAALLSQMKYGGVVAASGLTGGSGLPATVFPFIIRAVRLIGIDSVMAGMDKRLKVWELLAGEYKPSVLGELFTEIGLEQVSAHVDALLAGRSSGRVIIKL